MFRAVEVITKTSMLKLALPHASTEAAIRIFSSGGQWQRSMSLYEGLCRQGHPPSQATTTALFGALAQGNQLDLAEQLLKDLSSSSSSSASEGSDLTGPHNIVMRIVARQGDVKRASDMLDAALKADAFRVEGETFNCIAIELMKAGEQEKAEEVLEMRDYW